VTESNDSAIPIGTILTAINGLSTERMTPLELNKHFNSRERKVVPKFRVEVSDQVSLLHTIYTLKLTIIMFIICKAMSDVDYHGFLAKKSSASQKTYVTNSNMENILVGTEVLSLSGTALWGLKPNEITDLFKRRDTKLILNGLNRTISDSEFHGFVAKKTKSDRSSVVTESNDATIVIGSILKTINGIVTDTLTPMALSKFFSNRQNKVLPTFVVEDSATTRDAKSYAKKLDDLIKFFNCAL
jgi:hypothetical protein